jgi:hypothetical protein
MRTMRIKRATMPTAMPAFVTVEILLELVKPVVFPGLAPMEFPLELVEPVVFPGLDVDAELDCVVGLENPVGVAELEIWVWAARSLSSHITTIALAKSRFDAVSVDVGFTATLVVPRTDSTFVKTAPEGMVRIHTSYSPVIEVPGLEGFSKVLQCD